MSDMSAHAESYCSALVKKSDEDRWLAAQYASLENRRLLLALYAFQSELRRIPSAVSEPPLGEIRLQWWREAFQEIRDGKPPRAHPVVEEIAHARLDEDRFNSAIERAIDAAARSLYGEGFADLQDLLTWLEQADGSIDEMAVGLQGGDGVLARHAARAGAAFALAREGRALAPQFASEIGPAAIAIAKESATALAASPAEIAPGMLHLSLTRNYARRGARPFPLVRRLCLFQAMALRRF